MHKQAPQLLEDEAERIEQRVKEDLHRQLVSYIAMYSLTQTQISRLLGIHQPDVSRFLNGHIVKFSVGQMIRFASRLGFDVAIDVSVPPKKASRESEYTGIRARAHKAAC